MPEPERDNPGLPHLPPTYPVAFLACAIVLDWLFPVSVLPTPTFISLPTLVGAVLVAGGLGLDVWTYRVMQAAGTHAEPFKPTTTIVSHGPFSITRNPMYVGFLLTYTGLSIAFALEWGLLGLPFLWLVLDRVVVTREETYLSRKFGPTYAHYLTHTRRWL